MGVSSAAVVSVEALIVFAFFFLGAALAFLTDFTPFAFAVALLVADFLTAAALDADFVVFEAPAVAFVVVLAAAIGTMILFKAYGVGVVDHCHVEFASAHD